MKFDFTPLEIPEVILVEHEIREDARGFLVESYREDAFLEHGIPRLVQDNHSRSRRGVLRGLHYQRPPRASGKLVRCIRGRVFDVAVDLRVGSPTYARWVSVELSEDDRRMLWIPVGFAHGFCVLSDFADVCYRMTDYYAPEHERTIVWNDPDIAVRWPIERPELSPRDAQASLLGSAERDFVSPSVTRSTRTPSLGGASTTTE
jgi:dTDP-4-dehydrorhamnose 3,5-epimerase